MTMKYLFLIVVCGAVKCEDIGNNYFVVEMPEDNLHQQDIKDFKKPFQVFWNVPTMQCTSKKIPFQNLYEKFGIIQNDNDNFIGNKIIIIYGEKDFPAIIHNKTSGKNILRNGGVPQEGNLDKHLIAFENNLNDKIPDPYFDGIAVIDFESWRPVFRQNFGNLVPYKDLSIKIEKDLHKWWPKIWIEREASLRFEAASRKFMQTTLSMAKEKRPNARWGYYGFPYCYNMRDRNMTAKCAKSVDEENDSIYWLWAESTTLFPSLYSSVSLSSSQLSSLIKGRVKEASRVRGRDTPILPYFWYRYTDAGFITENDLEMTLTTLYQSNASGFIIWGSSNDVNTVENCNRLLNYVETVLGPKIAIYTKQRKRIHGTVKMPEDNLHQQDIKDFKKPFQVFWNVPTMQCTSKKIPFQNLYEKFGIIQNDNDNFIGNKIIIIYGEKDFPAIIHNKTSGKNILRNGGVPQEGNLDKHLIAFENNLNDKIPDPYFDGIAIIDFESWRPVFRQNFGNLVPYKDLSIKIEKDLHNRWPKMWIEKEASLRFEAASRKFMQTTLSMAKEKRPNALWGYYGFPYCYNMRDRNMTEKCAKNVDEENDSIYWLWAESTALFPSLYSSVSLSSHQLSSLIKGRVKEASRVRGRDTPIYPYFLYRYRDAGFITENDLEVALTTLYQSNASGFIIWGSSNDVNTVENCNRLLNYVETVLGPKIAKYTKQRKRIHGDNLENKEIYTKETSTVYDGFSFSRNMLSASTDKMFSTKSSTTYNKYDRTDAGSQTSNNEKISATENPIAYNDTDESQTLNNFDLSLSVLESSTIYNEYMNTNQSRKTLNNEEISSRATAFVYNEHTDMDESLQTLNNDDLYSFSSEISTPYTEYNIDQNSKTLCNKQSIVTRSFDNVDSEKSVDILNNDEVVFSSEFSTYDYENNDHRTTLTNDVVVSSSESSTFEYEDNEHSTTSNIDDLVSLSEFPSFKNKNIDYSTTVNNDVAVSLSESSTFDYKNRHHSKTTLKKNDVISSSEFSTFDYESNEHSTTFKYEDVVSLSESSTFDYKNSEHSLNNEDVVSLSKFSTFDYENSEHSKTLKYDDMVSISESSTLEENQSTDNLNNVRYSKDTSQTSDEIANTDRSADILSYGEILTKKNEYKSTRDDLLNNNMLDDSSEDRSDYLIKVDISTNIETIKQSEFKDSSDVDNDYLIMVRNLKNEPDFGENIADSKLETVYHTTQGVTNDKAATKSENFNEQANDLDLVVKYIDKNFEIQQDEDSTSTRDESFDKIESLNPEDSTSDYLIVVDNSTNIQTYNQSEHTNNTNADNDYLIIVTDV